MTFLVIAPLLSVGGTLLTNRETRETRERRERREKLRSLSCVPSRDSDFPVQSLFCPPSGISLLLCLLCVPFHFIFCSISRTRRVIFITESGLRDIESMPSLTRNSANSG